MNAVTVMRYSRRFAVVAGVLDFITGIALWVAPAFTLGWMGATPPPADALGFVRFIGVFVAAVGASYLWGGAGGAVRLRHVLTITLFFRAGAGMYSGGAVVAGEFDSAWLIVSMTDLACVAVQSYLLVKGVGGNA